MFKLSFFDGHYWRNDVDEYATYNEALIACYEKALQKTHELIIKNNYDVVYEVCTNFETTEGYVMGSLVQDLMYFPVAIVYYDKDYISKGQLEHNFLNVVIIYDIMEIDE